MRTEATGARKPEATGARKPEATSARKPEATSARKPEATRATEVMPPRAAVSAANWAANLGWVITATKLTGIRPIDRSYRKRGHNSMPPRLGRYRNVAGNDLGMRGLGTCCAFGKSLASGFHR